MRFFAIISWPRSGLHFLESSLNTHNLVECPIEPFNSDEVTALSAREYLDSYRATKVNVGITFHWNHVRVPYRDIWNIVIEEEWPIISLDRKDALAQFVSLSIAEKTQQWHTFDSVSPLHQLYVYPEEFMTWIDNRDKYRAENLSYLLGSKKSVLHITYESLVYGSGLADAQRYIGIPVRKIKPKTKKQGHSLEDTIINYDELVKLELIVA